MPRKIRQLGVWVGTDQIAVLEQRRRYEITCHYLDLALERWPLNAPVISCSLPLSDLRADALPYCRGLLPEGEALQAAAMQARVSVIDVFDLLAHFGRDIAGALVIGADPPPARDVAALPYSADALAEEVAGLPANPLGLHDDSELSLAGMQNKILLVRLPDGQWARPARGYPSTHILKVDDPRHPGLVEAEAAALHLARAVGLTSITTELTDIAGTRCLIVSRYDRRVGAATSVPVRVHQEDICQALGVDSFANRGRIKYERYGGPSFAQVAELLSGSAQDPPSELDQLVRIMTFNVLIGNADAHAKNLSLLHDPIGTVRLAPLYDTVPTVLWPRLRNSSAMRINGRDHLDQVTLHDLAAEAGRWSHSSDRANGVATDLIERTLEAATAPIIPDRLRSLVQGQARQLLSSVQP